MSHLGELLSALVDSELSGAELDRANAHLAACGACQSEAAGLRRLKQELRAIGPACDAGGIAGRLLGITGPDALAPPARMPGREPAGRGAPGSGQARRRRRGQPLAPASRGQAGPNPGRPGGRAAARRRGRYVLLGTVSLVVVGIGSAAFGMGGGSAGGTPGPQVTPQVEVFDLEHAITSGDVPFTDPTGRSGRTPAAAARP